MSASIDPERVCESVDRLLSTWAMMMVEPCRQGFSAFDQGMPVIVSKVGYSGDSTGSFTVLVQEPFVRALAANLLDDEADDSMLVDIAKELCNLLSGNLLTELYGCDRTFALDAPIVVISDLDAIAKEHWPHLSMFKADECPMALSFDGDSAA